MPGTGKFLIFSATAAAAIGRSTISKTTNSVTAGLWRITSASLFLNFSIDDFKYSAGGLLATYFNRNPTSVRSSEVTT